MAKDESMRLLTREGTLDVPITGDAEATDADGRELDAPSTLGGYWNAVQAFLSTGDEEHLEPFAGVRIAGYPLETDPDWIEYWAGQGELDFDDIYGD